MSTILKYFKPIVKSPLPSPEGPLSRDVPSSSIEAANKSVIAVMESEEDDGVPSLFIPASLLPLSKREAGMKSIPQREGYHR